MVRGLTMAVTAVKSVYQCAEMQRTARGRGNKRPTDCQALVKRLSSRAFIGLPWPMNRAGIGVFTARYYQHRVLCCPAKKGATGRQAYCVYWVLLPSPAIIRS